MIFLYSMILLCALDYFRWGTLQPDLVIGFAVASLLLHCLITSSERRNAQD